MYLSLNSHDPLIQFFPAELKEMKNSWEIVYYCHNPYSNRMERVRYKVNAIRNKLKTDTNARREIKKICVNINLKLQNGWSPFVDQSPFSIITLKECIEKYLFFKEKELRFESFHHYNSQLCMFKEWLEKNKMVTMLPSDFSKTHALKYMDYVLIERKVSNRTFNNYRTFLKTFFNWLIERNYCGKNPFLEIKPRKNETKTRKIIPIEERRKVVSYLKENNYPFFIFTLLEYSCLMRPIEIFRSQFQNYDLNRQVIKLRADQTKNHKEREITIPNNTIEELRKYFDYINAKKFIITDFVFSTGYMPGNILQTTRASGRTWSNLRTTLNLPKEFQLYSLRDSSITDMLLNNIPAITVQKHADHSSLEMTRIYSNHITPEMQEEIKKNSPSFY